MSKGRLPIPLKKLLEEPPPAHRGELWLAIQRERRARKLRRRSLAGAALVAALALLAFVAKPTLAPGGKGERQGAPLLALEDGAPLLQRVEPLDEPRVLALNDGSRVTVEPSARLEVLQTSPTRAEFALRRGKVRFEIRPHGPRVWRVDCGALSIEVLGTAFDVERQEQGVSVKVLRGAVLVRGATVPDSVQRLEGGQSLSVPREPSEARQTDDIDEDEAESESATGEPSDAVAPTDGRTAVQRSLVPVDSHARVQARTSTRSGRRRADERFQAQARGSRSGSSSTDDAERAGEKPESTSQVIARLLREADAARVAGRPSDALEPLTEIARRYPRDPEAALAAFALARLRLDVLDQPGDAVIDLERALALRLPEPLAEDARARLVEALARAGAAGEACVAAADYRVRYPGGTRKGRVERYCNEQRSGP
jgi:transmembrane sensor